VLLIFCPKLSLFVKNYSEFEILPDLESDRLACHSYMDAVRRHETKDFVTVVAVARVSASAPVPRASVPIGLCVRVQVRPVHTVDCIIGEEP